MQEDIRVGALTLRFLQTKQQTGGSLDLFEMTVPPEGRMPVPHYHESWDETVYGLTGTTCWTIDGRAIDLGPGETVFIARGVVHGFANRSGMDATCLCVLTPGALGPAYFQAIGAEIATGTPDPVKIRAIMVSYGLIPAPSGAS